MPRFKIKKQTVWRLHSVCGLIAGIGLLVIGLSGSVLMFSREIDGLLRPEVVRASPRDGASRLPMDELIGRVSASFPGHQIMGWVPAAEGSGDSDRAWVKLPDDEHWLFAHVDPHTGRILSRPSESTSHFTGWMLELHYSLLADHAGLLVAGLFAVLLVLLGISGVWLYRDFFRNFFRLRWGRSTRILFSDLHKFVGINAVVFNLVLGFTGAWWNLSHLIGHLFEEEHAEVAAAERPPAPGEWASVDAMLREAPKHVEGFEARYIGFPQTPDDAVHLYGRHGDAGPFRGEHGSLVVFEAKSGALRSASDVREGSLWDQIYDSFVPLHFGTFGGWPIRILWCLGGLAPGTLAVSGFVIWRSRRKKAKPLASVERSVDAGAAIQERGHVGRQSL